MGFVLFLFLFLLFPFFLFVWVGFASPFFHFQKYELGNVFLVLMVSGDFKVHLFLSFSLFGWGRRWEGKQIGSLCFGVTPPPPSHPSSPPPKKHPHIRGLFYWWNFAKF